jgi:hypothetical protein
MNLWLELLKVLGAPLVAGIVAAFLTNFLGAHFSLKRFRREQWWLQKQDAYDSIIRRLADIKFDTGSQLSSLETGGQAVPPKAQERTKALSWSLQEVASTGAYIVSAKTVQAVQRTLDVLASSSVASGGNFHEELSKDYGAAEEALKIVREEAHRDLCIVKERL